MAIRVLPNNPDGKGLVDLKANIPFASPDGKELCLQLLRRQGLAACRVHSGQRLDQA